MPGGIATFATHPEGLKDYFLPCLDEAEKLVVSNVRSGTPLILGATAGMRILRQVLLLLMLQSAERLN